MKHLVHQAWEFITKNIVTILLYGAILSINLLFESSRRKLTLKEATVVVMLAVLAGFLTNRICSVFIHNDDLRTVCSCLACLAGDKFLRRLMEDAPDMASDSWKTFIGRFKKDK